MISYLPDIAATLFAQALALISPGPAVLALMSTSMEKGRSAGLAMALGIAFGSMLWAALALFGMSQLLQTFPRMEIALELLGGAFFIYLGLGSLRRISKRLSAEDAIVENLSNFWRYMLQGFLIQASNPKAILVWLSLGLFAIKPTTPQWVPLVIVIGALLNSMLFNGAYALLFSSDWMMKQYLRWQKGLKLAFGVVFIMIGIRFILLAS